MVKINGEIVDAVGKTILEYLTDTNFEPKRVAVEKNGEIVPMAKYNEIVIEDTDVIEVVSFMGGG